ncbi:MAG: hypothetical protein HRF45_00210 [Fimbriimonadia bacterium]|jgi:hypothetical protein
MAEPIRRSDVAEKDIEAGIYWLIGSLVVALLGFLFGRYGGGGPVSTVGWIILAVTPIGLIVSGTKFYAAKNVPGVPVLCPYCHSKTYFLAPPAGDFTCDNCHRRVAVEDGKPLRVIEVKCGFCGSLQRFSERTEVALCEECDHEIPLASSETGHMKHLAKGIALEEDPRPYDLILVAPGPQVEPLIGRLQQVLALPRNQVKDMLVSLPVTLLHGIPMRKAKMLHDELVRMGAAVDMKPQGDAPRR